MTGDLFLLRGLPGAGKSSLAKALAMGRWPVMSVDDYFTDAVTGSYNFRFQDNHLAYKQCEELTENKMQARLEKIFLDNTFTLEWEMEPYFILAKKYDYRVFVITVENRHQGKNQHQISEEQIRKMAEKYNVRLF